MLILQAWILTIVFSFSLSARASEPSASDCGSHLAETFFQGEPWRYSDSRDFDQLSTETLHQAIEQFEVKAARAGALINTLNEQLAEVRSAPADPTLSAKAFRNRKSAAIGNLEGSLNAAMIEKGSIDEHIESLKRTLERHAMPWPWPWARPDSFLRISIPAANQHIHQVVDQISALSLDQSKSYLLRFFNISRQDLFERYGVDSEVVDYSFDPSEIIVLHHQRSHYDSSVNRMISDFILGNKGLAVYAIDDLNNNANLYSFRYPDQKSKSLVGIILPKR
jgi:hypothetical protein